MRKAAFCVDAWTMENGQRMTNGEGRSTDGFDGAGGDDHSISDYGHSEESNSAWAPSRFLSFRCNRGIISVYAETKKASRLLPSPRR
jgi:hypothetical protein